MVILRSSALAGPSKAAAVSAADERSRMRRESIDIERLQNPEKLDCLSIVR
jgi:hypothetical protein